MTASKTPIKPPKVTVAIPTYNGAAHLRETIDSVLAQTYRDFELVIVDDRSSDATDAVIQSYSDPRVRFLRNERNLGAEGNWNRCRTEARGEYFKLLPQDDLLAPDCLERQVAVFDNDTPGSIGMVFGARTVIDSNGRILLRRASFGRRRRVIRSREVIRKCALRGTNLIGEPGNIMLRRTLLEKAGAFDARNPYVVDLDYWFRVLQWTDAYYDPATTSAFRVSAGSWSVAIGQRQYDDLRDFLRRYAADPKYALSRIDVAVGTCMAWLNAKMRQLIYRYLLLR